MPLLTSHLARARPAQHAAAWGADADLMWGAGALSFADDAPAVAVPQAAAACEAEQAAPQAAALDDAPAAEAEAAAEAAAA